MARRTQGWKLLLIGSVFAACSPALFHSANAAQPSQSTHRQTATRSSQAPVHQASSSGHVASKQSLSKNAKAHYTTRSSSGGLQCVPFARAASGIELKGNATNWWQAASGVYERGQRPETGSVLNFRSTGRMRLGHVAVVTNVVNSREVEIDHANWAGPGASKGGVSRGIPVMDVSEANDWSSVRVGLGHSGDFGSVYPTYGFIYDRPDRGIMVANKAPAVHAPVIAATASYDEVAEAPAAQPVTRRASYYSSNDSYR